MVENVKRVNLTIPKRDYELIENEIIKKGYFVHFSEYIRHLIKEDLKRRGLLK